MNYFTLISATVFISFLSGCASITTSAMQPISIKTKNKEGSDVVQANCSLKNEKGQWSVVTPNIVSVHKAASNLAVNCKKAGLPDGNLSAISRAGAGMYGNILVGGVIGAAIDHNSGKAYKYPDSINVVMGDSVMVDRHKPNVAKNDEKKENQSLNNKTVDCVNSYPIPLGC